MLRCLPTLGNSGDSLPLSFKEGCIKFPVPSLQSWLISQMTLCTHKSNIPALSNFQYAEYTHTPFFFLKKEFLACKAMQIDVLNLQIFAWH